MKTQVSIPHHDYPGSIRAVVEQRLEGLARFYDRIVSIRAVLDRQRATHHVEIVANVGHGTTLVVDAQGDLLNAALDRSIERMESVLSRHKDRLTRRQRRGAGAR